MAAVMKRAGCKGVEFGTDGGSEKTLAALGKPFTPDDIAHASESCRSVDFASRALYYNGWSWRGYGHDGGDLFTLRSRQAYRQ